MPVSRAFCKILIAHTQCISFFGVIQEKRFLRNFFLEIFFLVFYNLDEIFEIQKWSNEPTNQCLNIRDALNFNWS